MEIHKLKNSISETNNSIGGFKNEYDSAEEMVSVLEGKLINKSKMKH